MIRLLSVLAAAAALSAQAASPEGAIRKVMEDQVAAWNRADIESFVEGYADSPDTLFIGSTITEGRAGVLERYRKTYTTPEKMGKLEFSDLRIRMLGANYATVIGRFHLHRAAESGGDAAGIFTLIFQNSEKGWKIIQDHTS